MSFMQPDIHNEIVWILETNIGTEIVPISVHDISDEEIKGIVQDLLDGLPDDEDKPSFDELYEREFPNLLTEEFGDYIEGNTVYSGECKEQWTARLSAPGYLDTTETSSFDTEVEAIEHLLDTYGNDDMSEDWEAPLIDRLGELGASSYKQYAGDLAAKVLEENGLTEE